MTSPILFEASASTTATTSTDITWSHTVSTNDGRILIVNVTHQFDGEDVAGVTYAGEAMTEATHLAAGSGCYVWAYYLANPAPGANNITVQADPDLQYVAAASASYSNINLDNPIRTVYSTGGTSDAFSVNIADGQPEDLLISIIGADDNATFSQGESSRVTVSNTSNASAGIGDLDLDVGGSSVGISATGAKHAVIGFALVPRIASLTRAVKYFHDINDPQGRIYDDSGRMVMPWELRPNNWIRVTGLFLPSSTKYESFTQDPELAYIEEVQFSGRGGLHMKTNRGELTEVLLARAAGAQTL